CHWSRCVLAVRDRDDARTAYEPDCRLDAHEGVCRRRTNHRAVGFGAYSRGAEIGGDGNARARTRAARIAIQHVRIPGLSTTTAPAARRFTGTKVGPLAEIGFAEDDYARVAKFF